METVVARSDVVKASDEDMRWLDKHSSPEELAARWLTLGPSIVAVTFGAHGSYAISAGFGGRYFSWTCSPHLGSRYWASRTDLYVGQVQRNHRPLGDHSRGFAGQ